MSEIESQHKRPLCCIPWEPSDLGGPSVKQSERVVGSCVLQGRGKAAPSRAEAPWLSLLRPALTLRAASSRVTRALLWRKVLCVWGQPEVLVNWASILFPSSAGFISRATEQSLFTSDLHNITLDFWFSLKTSLDSDDSVGQHGFSARICISGCLCKLKILKIACH